MEGDLNVLQISLQEEEIYIALRYNLLSVF